MSETWRAAASPVPAPAPAPAPDETALKALRQETAVLKARLWETEWTLREIADGTAREEALKNEVSALKSALAEALAAASDARPDPALAARAETAEAEAEKLAARLADAEAALDSLRAERATAAPAEAAEERPAETRAAAFRTAEPLARDDGPASGSEAETAAHPAPSDPPPPAQDPAPNPAPDAAPDPAPDPAPASAPAAGVAAGPMLGVEAAALELLEKPEAEGTEQLWPRGLARFLNTERPDDLTLIAGLGPELNAGLDRLGVRSFKQIAEISPEGLAWIDRRLGLGGRTVRERWVPQAQMWRDRKREGLLGVDPGGRWTAVDLADAETETEPQPEEATREEATREEATREAATREAAAPTEAGAGRAPLPAEPPAPDPQPAAAAPDLEPVDLEPVARVTLPAPLRLGMKAERADLTPPPPNRVETDGPLSGLEAAALESVSAPDFDARLDTQPEPLSRRPGESDDLTLIHGVGPVAERALGSLGATTFAQIADLDADGLAWLDRALDADGRVARERWAIQARVWAERKQAGALRLAVSGPQAGRWTDPSRAEETAAPDPTQPTADAGDGAEAGARDTAPATARRAGLRPFFLGKKRARPLLAPKRPADGGAARVAPDGRAAFEREAGALLEADDPRLDGHRPSLLLRDASNGPRDDLKLIQHAGPKFMDIMNQIGVFYFAQLAQFDALDLAWLDRQLAAGGRVARDRWGSQAQALQARKASGALALGAEGFWTEPDPAAEIDAVFDQARALPLSDAEIEAMRLITAGGVTADDASAPSGLLPGPDQGAPDDLQRIKGVGPRCEALLNRMGVFYYRQIAAFSAAELAWIDAKIRYNGRVVRDRWATIARLLDAADDGARVAEDAEVD